MKEPKAYEACISSASLADTGFSYTLSLISGKYKMTILYTLMRFQVVRFNAMKKYIGGAGGRSADPPGGVPPDSAQSGVQPYPAGEVSDSDSGPDV